MNSDTLERRGLILLGCGKMGSAMLAGWLNKGLSAGAVHILDPAPSQWLRDLAMKGMHLNQSVPPSPAVVLIAIKPQMMGDALLRLQALGNGETLFVSVAAGIPISTLEAVLGRRTPIVRAMPNTPAAIGKGITALIGNARISGAQFDLAEGLLGAVGQTVRLADESQMDAVTAVSGSGPAYVFHLIETLAAAGQSEGLSAELSMALAKATVAGAGALAETAVKSPEQLRKDVTSPAGTTAAALEVLMDRDSGFPMLLTRAVKAAADRSRTLGKA